MGLDQYAFSVDNQRVPNNALVDVELYPTTTGRVRFFYWRKHPDLHGWMKALYDRRGGRDGNFNCSSVQLLSEDLDVLEKDIETDNLPRTKGFFFGTSRPEDKERGRDFLRLAREELSRGRMVFYFSWW